jgi:hypothetical protein
MSSQWRFGVFCESTKTRIFKYDSDENQKYVYFYERIFPHVQRSQILRLKLELVHLFLTVLSNKDCLGGA